MHSPFFSCYNTTMNVSITIGISACLYGDNTRYDGGNRHEPALVEELTRFATLLPICPEAECGLGIPREPMRLTGEPENPRLMTINTCRDLTEQMRLWARQRLETFAGEGIAGLILKSRSPSCGTRVAVHGDAEIATSFSPGIFAGIAGKRFPGLPVADEEELSDPARLADFLKRLSTAKHAPQEKER